MPDLPGPMEIFELRDGESRAFTVTRSEEGTTLIHPATAPQGKQIPVLRLHVESLDKPTFPHYYDVTSLTLQAQLRPLVAPGAQLPRRFTVTKVGTGPSARFTMSSTPPLGSFAT